MLSLNRVSHWFELSNSANDSAMKILDHVSLTLQSGQSLALMGTSGSGKSTLLQIAAGLEKPQQGQVFLADQDLYNLSDDALSQLRREKIGFVFQQFNLLPGLTVIDNILFQTRLNAANRIDNNWLEHILETLDLTDLRQRLPEQLSGGQQQRVAIARAVAHQPKIVFADEPTGNLNDSLSHSVMALLTALSKEARCALLMVTHSSEMASYTDQTLMLQQGSLLALEGA